MSDRLEGSAGVSKPALRILPLEALEGPFWVQNSYKKDVQDAKFGRFMKESGNN